jgi:3-hydroxybutyryl-CoA dehydratase
MKADTPVKGVANLRIRDMKSQGKTYETLLIGERIEESKTVERRDVFSYLGLADDLNPLFSQSVYAERTEFEQVVVPPSLLVNWFSALVSMKLPGPGSLVQSMQFDFPAPLFIQEEVVLKLEISDKLDHDKKVKLVAKGMSGDKIVAEGELLVCPPRPLKPLFKDAFENF